MTWEYWMSVGKSRTAVYYGNFNSSGPPRFMIFCVFKTSVNLSLIRCKLQKNRFKIYFGLPFLIWGQNCLHWQLICRNKATQSLCYISVWDVLSFFTCNYSINNEKILMCLTKGSNYLYLFCLDYKNHCYPVRIYGQRESHMWSLRVDSVRDYGYHCLVHHGYCCW